MHAVKMDLVPSEHHQTVRTLTVRLVASALSVTHMQTVKIADHQMNAARQEGVATEILVQKISDNLNA